jgi:hypothetical protein
MDTIKGSKSTKRNSTWMKVFRELVINKKGFNGQVMIRTRFFHKDHPEMKSAHFKNTVVETAKLFRDIYDYLK